jgi:hypothetical protein
MSMQWTRQPPTEAGFYYWQGNGLMGLQVTVVQVNALRSGAVTARELVLDYRHAPTLPEPADWGGKWAGPLPQPI